MAFISISKCFNISPHLRWFMAFIRGHERLAFLWFRDLISAWHIQRLNRVLRSHFLRTPSAQPGLVIWATILQDMLYSLSRWLRGIFAPRVIDKVAEMKIFRRRVVTSCSTVHVRHFRSFLAPGNVLRVSLKERWAEEDAIIIVGNRPFSDAFSSRLLEEPKTFLPDVRL